MKGYAMLKSRIWMDREKDRPACGPMDAICKPLAAAICTSDVHTLWKALSATVTQHDLRHECCAEVEVGLYSKGF